MEEQKNNQEQLEETAAVSETAEEVLETAAPAEETPAAEDEIPLPDLDAPMAPATTVVAAGPTNFDELELAAYRRAVKDFLG